MAVEAALSQRGHRVLQLDPAIVELSGIDWSQFDVAFIALHGRFGEDGQVQQILDEAGVPYTGSDAAASRLAFSKSAAKERFLQRAVPTPAYSLIHYTDDLDRVHRKAAGIGYPLVVKPDTQGSSLGITIVRDPRELSKALKLCFQFDGFGLLETMIEGTEWTVGLIDSQVLPPIKIETDNEFFDWQAKYDDDATRYIFDSMLPDQRDRKDRTNGFERVHGIGNQRAGRESICDSMNNLNRGSWKSIRSPVSLTTAFYPKPRRVRESISRHVV